MVTGVIELVARDNNSFKALILLFYRYTMDMILARQEREKLVVDLYTHNKNTREIFH